MHIIKAVGVLFVAKDHGIGLRVHGIAFRALLPALWSHRICGRTKQICAHWDFQHWLRNCLRALNAVLYGLMGFVTGALGGLLYNLFARWSAALSWK
jgi:hypothetical protein